MSHESEHSESEFYYPGELSHAEQLHQSPTQSKSKERNLTLFANEEAHNFLRSQQETGGEGNNFSGQTVRQLTFEISKQSSHRGSKAGKPK